MSTKNNGKGVTLTSVEARIAYSNLRSSGTPLHGLVEYKSLMDKLLKLGGGVTCRYCTNVGVHPHHTGELVCEKCYKEPPIVRD